MMEKSRSSKWIIVAIVAAVIAALTTVAILLLRARAQKKAWFDEEPDFGYDLEADDVVDVTDEVDAVDSAE